MSNDQERSRRTMVGLRLKWLQGSGVALPDDLAETARRWIEEEQAGQAATVVAVSLEERERL